MAIGFDFGGGGVPNAPLGMDRKVMHGAKTKAMEEQFRKDPKAFKKMYGKSQYKDWKKDMGKIEEAEARAADPNVQAKKWLKGGSFGKGQPTWDPYQRISKKSGELKKDWRLDEKKIGTATSVLRNRAMQRADALDPSRAIAQRRMQAGANLGQDVAARESANRFSDIRNRFGGGAELSAIRGAGQSQAIRMTPQEQLRDKETKLRAENVRDRMGQLQSQVGLDVAATAPRQFNISQGMQERALEDESIFNKWAMQKKAVAAKNSGDAIGGSKPKEGFVTKVMSGFGL